MTRNQRTKVTIAIGAGGVGKTTVASVLGIYYARRGEKVLVITVDPARRLLDSMGVKQGSDEPQHLDFKHFVDGSESVNKTGALFLFMPNLKKEWTSFLEAAITNADTRKKIAANHFFTYMAEGMPGALEIICSHILYRLMASGDFDRIVLDTPPSSHSISFFDVPQKISRVLTQSVFRSLMSKRNSLLARFTKKLAFFSGGILQNTFERIIGSHFLSELIEFALSIDELYEPLLHRVRAMDALLKDDATNYTLIIKPTTASVQDSAAVQAALKERGIVIDQIIVNQMMPFVDDDALGNALVDPELTSVKPLLELYQKEIRFEKELLARVRHQFPDKVCRLLFMGEATASRTALLKQLVTSLEQEF